VAIVMLLRRTILHSAFDSAFKIMTGLFAASAQMLATWEVDSEEEDCGVLGGAPGTLNEKRPALTDEELLIELCREFGFEFVGLFPCAVDSVAFRNALKMLSVSLLLSLSSVCGAAVSAAADSATLALLLPSLLLSWFSASNGFSHTVVLVTVL
jgi:hypothetical protein